VVAAQVSACFNLALVACAGGSYAASASVALSAPPGQTQGDLTTTVTIVPTTYFASLRTVGTAALQPNFQARLEILSFFSGTFHNEGVFCQLTGAQPAGAATLAELPASYVLFAANRPFDPTVDKWVWTQNGAWTASGASPSLRLEAQVCGAVDTLDCCAELNDKLDQVLAAVRRTYTNP
jgi:hypothetical protein